MVGGLDCDSLTLTIAACRVYQVRCVGQGGRGRAKTTVIFIIVFSTRPVDSWDPSNGCPWSRIANRQGSWMHLSPFIPEVLRSVGWLALKLPGPRVVNRLWSYWFDVLTEKPHQLVDIHKLINVKMNSNQFGWTEYHSVLSVAEGWN